MLKGILYVYSIYTYCIYVLGVHDSEDVDGNMQNILFCQTIQKMKLKIEQTQFQKCVQHLNKT